MESNSKILSVCLITYNHEKYIRQAIDSVLNQKVDFEFELVIADDCSTDSTRSILLEYKQKYSHFIHLILQEKNVGPARNWLDLLRFPRSKYIAYFEGDDFWTDPYKLQKQVDFLEQNESYVLCSSDGDVVDHAGNLTKDIYNHSVNAIFSMEDAYKENIVTSSSLLFRATYIHEFKYDNRIHWGDYYLLLYLLQFGNGYCFREKMAVYRSTGNGIWSSIKGDFLRAKQHYLFYKIMITKISHPIFLKVAHEKIEFYNRMLFYKEFEKTSIESRLLSIKCLYESFRVNRKVRSFTFKDYLSRLKLILTNK